MPVSTKDPPITPPQQDEDFKRWEEQMGDQTPGEDLNNQEEDNETRGTKEERDAEEDENNNDDSGGGKKHGKDKGKKPKKQHHAPEEEPPPSSRGTNPNQAPEEGFSGRHGHGLHRTQSRPGDDQRQQQSQQNSLRNQIKNRLQRNQLSSGGKGKSKIAGKGKQAAKKAARNAGSKLTQAAIKSASSNPYVVAFIIVFILVFALIIWLIGDHSQNQAADDCTAAGATTSMSLSMTGPDKAPNPAPGSTLTYTITLSTTTPQENVTLTNPIPDGTEYESGSGVAQTQIDPSGKIVSVSWTFDKIEANQSPSVTLVLRPTKPNFRVFNIASLSGGQIGDGSGGTAGGVDCTGGAAGGTSNGTITTGNVPPTVDDCHGIYRASMNMNASWGRGINKKNYGDPKCDLALKSPNGNYVIDSAKILTFLQKINPKQARGIWVCILPNESSYNANAWNPNSTSHQNRGSPGAFGLFQMNAQGFSNTGQPEDVGDVVWTLQTTNANSWNNKYIGGTWKKYWPEGYQGCLAKYGV